jgi:hypothetical protein
VLVRDVVADRAAQHWIAGLERVEDHALPGLTLDLELLEAKYHTFAPKTQEP